MKVRKVRKERAKEKKREGKRRQETETRQTGETVHKQPNKLTGPVCVGRGIVTFPEPSFCEDPFKSEAATTRMVKRGKVILFLTKM